MEYALGRMGQLVFKPTGESGGKGVFIGPATDPVELAGLPTSSAARPRSGSRRSS
jgi:hypothetical protein